MTPEPQPKDKGELEYGSILPNGEDWRLRRFDAGMGETEYRLFRNETFFAMFDNREDADIVMGLMTGSTATSAEQVQYERIFTLPEEDKSDPYLPMWLIESGITAEIEMAICNCKQCKIVISELRQQQEREQR